MQADPGRVGPVRRPAASPLPAAPHCYHPLPAPVRLTGRLTSEPQGSVIRTSMIPGPTPPLASLATDRRALLALALAAASGPSLLAYNVSPSPTFLNQALAVALWGWFVAATATLGGSANAQPVPWRGPAALLAALAVLVAAALWSWVGGSLPASLSLSSAGMLLAAAVLVLSGASARARADAPALFALFCLGWALAGVLNAAIGIAQVFAPTWPDGDWVARSTIPGRAVGNLRQPNHLASLLLWSAIALAVLVEMGRLRRLLGALLFGLMVFGVVLSASRTGLVGVLVLALWALVDRRLARSTRLVLLSAPLLYALFWFGLAAWAEMGRHTFGGEARLAEADLSGSRFGIWSNTLTLIRQQPWTGVGFGEFNFAWTLTPFPGRPPAFFDHTHSLPLQLAVELGLPLSALVLALLALALVQAGRGLGAADRQGPALGMAQRGALLMVLMIGLHSLLEYPLWYAYFLLPAAWAWGFALGADAESPAPLHPRGGVVMAVAGVLLVMAAVASVFDYLRVVSIFAPGDDARSLEQRIESGRQSLLFSHHADYAAATAGDPPPDVARAFGNAAHYLLDTRLMMAWARNLAARGDADRASYVAQRLKEFRNPQADEFFEPCAEKPAAPPFQCQPPQGALGWRDFQH